MDLRIASGIAAVILTACSSAPTDVADPATTSAPTAPSTTSTVAAAVADTVPSSSVRATTSPAPTSPATTSTAASTGRTLFAFTEAGDVEAWSNVNDNVMGGVSSSTSSWEDGAMVFAGELSLDNNGGFTSIRGPIELDLGARIGDARQLVVEATGDGRTYLLQLRTLDDLQYVQQFSTEPGVEARHELAFAAFEPVGRFLDPLPGAPALDPSRVAQVVVYLVEKAEGPFRLALRRIAAA